MPFSEKHRERSRSSTSHSPRQFRQQQPPPPPCTTATTSTNHRNNIRKSRSASRDENADIMFERCQQRSKSCSLSRTSHRSANSDQQHISGGGGGIKPARRIRSPVYSSNTTKHHRSGGIPNVSFGRRRGRSETPKVGEAEGRKQRLHRSQQHKPTGGGIAASGGVMNKFRSLSRSGPNFSMRGRGGDGRGESRTPKQQQEQNNHQPAMSEYHFNRRNTSNEARRRFDNTDDITLPLPKRGKSMPSRLKVSMRLSRDDHLRSRREINKQSSRSRSRHHRSSGDSGGRGVIRTKTKSNSHVNKEHFTTGQRLGVTQNERSTKSRHPHSSPNRKTDANRHHRVRSKSMPNMGVLRNGILLVNKHQSIKYPVSTIASIDSSWRYKRIKMMKRLQRQKIQKQQSQRQDRSDNNIYYEQERIRSISCDPSILRVALVPYHAKHPPNTSITNKKSNSYLNYNLGEIDEELIELLRQQRLRSSQDSSSLQWPSRMSPKTSMPWGKSRRCCGVSTPTSEDRSPRGKKDKFVTTSRRRTGNGGDDFSFIISNGEADTDTTGWQGRAPDPVKSLHGSSYWAENTRYQRHSPTPSSSPLPDKLLVTSPSSPDDSRDSFIGIIESDGGWSSGRKSNSPEPSGEDKSSSSKRRESISNSSSQNDEKDSGNSDSPASILNKTSSSHAKHEEKIDFGFLVPPLHSTVRSRKPKAKVVPKSQHHHRSHSNHNPLSTKSGGKGDNFASAELKSRSSNGIVEGMTITNKDSDSTTDHVSEVTMPFELSRAPPFHEFIRSVKPQNRSHGYSSHPTSPVTRHPRSESHKHHHPEGLSPQFLSALRAIHQVTTSLEHSNKSLEYPPKALAVPLYPPPPPPPPPRRMAPGPPPRNQYKHALNEQQQQQEQQPLQQRTAHDDIPLRQLQSQTLDDLYQSSTQLRSQRERHHHSDRAFFPPQTSRDRYIEMTGGGHSGALHSSLKDVSKFNDSNIWQQQLPNSSTTEVSRLRGPMMCPEREGEGFGGQQYQVPPIPSIGGSAIGRQRGKRVDNMPYMDVNQEMGLYTGETNELGQPHGKGTMKYDNGIFFEGKWANGIQDGVGASRERLLSGFTSWKGTAQSKKNGNGKEFAHGMIWVNPFNGRSGRYTGDLNQHGMPHGRGVMRYDFGLIAEGEWNNGQIIDDSFQGCPGPASLLAGSVRGNFPLAP